jgi:hypothetical protein
LLTKELISNTYGLTSALLLAIQPWAIHFSRGSWEANVNLTLTALATLLFLKRRFALSALFFGTTLWTYQGSKLFTPLIILTLLVLYRSRYHILDLAKPLFITVVVALPILVGVATQSGRLKVFSVFSYTRQPETIQAILNQDKTDQINLTFYLFHSEFLDQARGVVQRYLNHFSPRYLFFAGDWSNTRQATPFSGYLYIPEILTLIFGFYFTIKNYHLNPKAYGLIIAWALLSPVPSAFSRDIVSAVRSLPLLLPLALISGIGLVQVSNRKILRFLYFGSLIFFLVYFLDLYFIHSPHYTAEGWLYPYKASLAAVAKNMDNYDKIVFTPKLGQPYIFTLFYLAVDPAMFQSQVHLTESPVGDVGHVPRFGKFEFRAIYWPNDRGLSSTLFVGDQYELPESDLQVTPNVQRLSEVTYPNGSPGLTVVGLP